MISPNPSVLFILTSADLIGPADRQTGYEFSEVAHPYLTFVAGGYDVFFASLAGGRPPEDGYDSGDPASVIFRKSRGFEQLNKSSALAQVDLGAYSSVFFPGGLGPMVDMLHDPLVGKVVATAFESGKVVGAVCHGPVALLNVKLSDGSHLLNGRHVAAFTSAEEVGHSEHDVPFMLDVELVRQGARHTHAAPFEEHVVADGRLVTGQNPASAAGVARAMMGVLQGRGPCSSPATTT